MLNRIKGFTPLAKLGLIILLLILSIPFPVYATTAVWEEVTANNDVYYDLGDVGIGTGDRDVRAALEVVGGAADPAYVTSIYDGDGEFSKFDTPLDFVISGNILIQLAYAEHAVNFIDISDPSNPNLLSEAYDGDGEFSKLAGPTALDISGQYAYVVSSQDDKLTVIDFSDPSDPDMVFEGLDFYNTNDIVISGNYAFVAVSGFSDGQIHTIDISNPSNPINLGKIKSGDAGLSNLKVPRELDVVGDILYAVCYDSSGGAVFAFDISDPANPVEVGEIYDGDGEFTKLKGGSAIDVEGNYAYVTSASEDAFTIIDISDPSDMDPIAQVDLSYPGNIFNSRLNGPEDILVSGDMLYIASYLEDKVIIVDISDTSNLSVVSELEDGVGSYTRLDGPKRIGLSDGYLFIASQQEDAITVANVKASILPQLSAGMITTSQLSVRNTFEVTGDANLVGSLSANFGQFQGGLSVYAESTNTAMTVIQDGTGDIFIANDGTTTAFVVADGGNVGVGTDTPTQILDVNGEIRTRAVTKGVCDADSAGTIAYEVSSDIGTFYGCKQTAASTFAWTALN